MHPAARLFVAGSRPEKRDRVLELGSYDVNGSCRDLFPDSHYVGVDLRTGPGVDVQGNAACVATAQLLKENSWDVVLCLETLEHTDEGEGIIANAARLLRPGGRLIVTTAGPGRAPHGIDGGGFSSGEFYRNLDVETLADWLERAGFSPKNVCEASGREDVQAWGVKAGNSP